MTTHNRATVQTLIEGNRYRVEILPELEAYVQQQVANNENHLEANLAVLKLYQFYTDKTNLAIIKAILLKALTALPEPDFLYASSLLRESVVSNSSLSLYFSFFFLPKSIYLYFILLNRNPTSKIVNFSFDFWIFFF